MKIKTDNKWKYPKIYLGTYNDVCFGWKFGTIVIAPLYDIVNIIAFVLVIVVLIKLI